MFELRGRAEALFAVRGNFRGRRFGSGHRFSCLIQNLPAHAAAFPGAPGIFDDGAELQSGVAALHVCTYNRIPLAQMQGIGLGEPHVAINTRAFVEPAVAQGRIHANRKAVLFPIEKKIGQLEAERDIAVVIAADKVAIAKDQRAAKSAIEIEEHATALVALGHVEDPAVPAHARLRIPPA